jgi:hypothetical protein
LFSYSLFAENEVIVRNLNYRPWQWVYIREYQFASSTDNFPKSQEELEESVSVLLDRKWCLTPDEEYEPLNH